MTAGEFAAYFEVSVRTVYRDMERLSEAGIPFTCRKERVEEFGFCRNLC